MNAHAPALQVTLLALRPSHFFAHDPQCAGSLRVFVSHPVLPLSQCVKPLAHVQLQAPPAHFGVPFLVTHALPQPPQLRTSPVVSMHKPAQHCPLGHGCPGGLQLWTHAPPGLHALPPLHWSLVMHSTQRCFFVSQCGTVGLIWQSLSCLQPSVH